MKLFLTTLLCLLMTLSYGQDTLKANRLKVTNGQAYRVVNKNAEPVVVKVDESKFILQGEIIVPASTSKVKLEDGTTDVTYYLFDRHFIKAVAHYDKDGKLTKFAMLDIDGLWFIFYEEIFKV